MIIFESVKWKNLLSTGNVFTEITLNNHKTTLVVGENGSGKSTMLDALSFALFGKPFRKINKGQLVNSINGKNLVVEARFKIGSKQYIVKRGIKPSIFEVYSDGFLLNQEADSRDYQDILETQILKFNHKSFTQIVAAGSALFVPFMQLPTTHRREIVEDLLDIQIFTTMNTLLKKDLETNRMAIADTAREIALLEQRIELSNNFIKTHKKSSGEKLGEKLTLIQKYEHNIDTWLTEVAVLNKSLIKYQAQIKDKQQVQHRLQEIRDLQRSLVDKLQRESSDKSFFENHETCPTCRQGIPHEHKKSETEKFNRNIKQYKKEARELIQENDKLIARRKDIDETSLLINETVKNMLAKEGDIELNKSLLEQVKRDVEDLQTNDKQLLSLEEDVCKATTQLQTFFTQKDELFKDRQVLEVTSELLKDNGIKTRIIRQYVPIMNKLINKYLASMDFFVNFELNENFEETIKSRFRDEFSYHNFSEGEKARLDIALLFTWRAIAKLRNSASTNLLVMDEIFDSSLDTNGGEELLKIITTLADNSNVFVISHKTDQMIDKFERVIKFSKTKGFSHIVHS